VQLSQCFTLRGTVGGLLEFAQKCRGEPRHRVFHDVIAGTGFHRRHRSFLTNGPGEEDERDVEARRLEYAERLKAVETGHVVVGDHRVPRLPPQCSLHRGGARDALVPGVEAPELQHSHREPRVVFGILDQQDVDRLAHSVVGKGGTLFSISQKMPSTLTASMNSVKSTGLRT